MFNGSSTEEFKNQKAFRQGDPLAPFLFLLVVEELGGLMREATSKGLFQGYHVGNSDLHVSSLHFIDDALFFGVPNRQHLLTLKAILRFFEMVSGLKVNFHGSKVARVATTGMWI